MGRGRTRRPEDSRDLSKRQQVPSTTPSSTAGRGSTSTDASIERVSSEYRASIERVSCEYRASIVRVSCEYRASGLRLSCEYPTCARSRGDGWTGQESGLLGQGLGPPDSLPIRARYEAWYLARFNEYCAGPSDSVCAQGVLRRAYGYASLVRHLPRPPCQCIVERVPVDRAGPRVASGRLPQTRSPYWHW